MLFSDIARRVAKGHFAIPSKPRLLFTRKEEKFWHLFYLRNLNIAFSKKSTEQGCHR
jgi:hypothetical protein